MSFEAQTEKFEKWLESRGVAINPKIRLHDYREQNQGRGMIALETVQEGETLFTIPDSALVNLDNVPQVQRVASELDEWPQLILAMMFVAQGQWAPYFDVLPTTFNTPMFWADAELEKLSPSAVVDKIGRQEANEMYQSLRPVLSSPEFEGIDTSEQTFHRMGSLIMAYGFDLLHENEEETSKAMVPLADMLNSHSKLKNARLEMPDRKGDPLEMIATTTIEKGQQVYNFYGELPNSDLLRRYGYVEAGGNASDVAEISLDLLLKASTSADLSKWEKYDEAEILDESYDIGDEGVPDPDILAVANLLSQNQYSKKNYRKCLEMAEDEELWPQAKTILRDAIKLRLQEYSNLPAVPAPNASQVYTDIDSMCAQILHSEKQVLSMALEWLGEVKRQKLN